MIWYWLQLFFATMARLVIPPPSASPDLYIDRNEKCPACGHREGELRTVMDAKQTILVQHRCKICGARWHEKTVLAAKAGIIIPAQVLLHADQESTS